MSVILYGGLVLLIGAGLIAGLDYLREGREMDRLQRLGDADNAARMPVRRPDPALGCRFCRPPFAVDAPCECADPCEDPQCGALIWAAISNEEWER